MDGFRLTEVDFPQLGFSFFSFLVAAFRGATRILD